MQFSQWKRQALGLLACAAVVAAALAPARAAAGDKKGDKTDQERFQGAWGVVSVEKDGMKFPDEIIKEFRIAFAGDKMTLTIMGTDIKATVKLDPAKKPKQIDVTMEGKAETGAGIYEFDGENLRICANEGKDRPTAFKSEGNNTLIVLKREKAEKKPEDKKPGATPPARGKGKADQDAIQGTWDVVSVERNGKAIPEAKDFQVVFAGDKMTIKIMGMEIKGTFKLDPSKTPKHVDVVIGDKEESGKGIYSLDGDTLKVCHGEGKADRPKDFKTDGDLTLMVFKRAKADKKTPPPPPPAPPARGKGKADQDAIQGTWSVVSLDHGGTKVPEDQAKTIKLVFAGDKMTIEVMGTELKKGTFKLDPSKTPKHMDVTLDKDENGQGIYELTGDSLKICHGEGKADRPKDFKSEGNYTVVVLKREKAEKKVPPPAPPARGKGKSDKDALQGTWTMVEGAKGGKPAPAAIVSSFKLTVEGDKLILNVGDQKIEGTYTLDEKQKPRHMDTTIDFKLARCIYELAGDTLKICIGEGPDAARPKEFKSEDGSSSTYLVLKREKAEKKAGEAPPARGKDKSDKDALQGSWTMVEGSKGGKPPPAEVLSKFKLTFASDKITVTGVDGAGKDVEGTYKIDDKQKPRHIDMTVMDKAMAGIYELTGDTLKICFADEGAERPKEFKSPDGARTIYMVLKRAKAETKEGRQRPAPTPDAPPARSAQVKDEVQGTWQPTTIIKGKDKIPDEAKQILENMRIEFSKGKVSFTIFDMPMEGTYTTDASKTPKQIDITIMDQKVQGIYELKGTKLKICGGEPGKGRPADFSGANVMIIEMKRIDNDPECCCDVEQPVAVARGDKKTDKDRVQGTWAVESVIEEGKELPKEIREQIRFVVTGDKVKVSIDKLEVEGKITLDDTKTPKQCDLTVMGKTSIGIYTLEGDTWKICSVDTDKSKERPKEFKSEAGKPFDLIVLKRVKDAKEVKEAQEQVRRVLRGELPEVAARGAKKDDKALFQGTWQPTKAMDDGKEMGKEFTDVAKITFDGDKFKLSIMDLGLEGTFKLDPSKKPKQIDITMEGTTNNGIYEFDGDTLKLCGVMSDSGKPRPTEFKSEAGSKQLLVILKRVKTDKDKDKEKPKEEGRRTGRGDEGPAARGAKDKTDQDKLQGAWKVAAVTERGNKVPADEAGKVTATITGDKLNLNFAGEKSKEGTFKLDATKKPAQIDLMIDGKTIEAIYELTGDTFKVCGVEKGDGARPTEFKSEAGTKVTLIEFRRGAKDDKKQEAKAKTDQEAIAGVWKFTRGRGDGEDMPAEFMRALRLVFEADGKLSVLGNERGDEGGTFKLDPAKSPKQIDLAFDRDKAGLGIYKLEGDTLTLCLPEGPGRDQKRPAEFAAEKGSKQIVFVLERTRPAAVAVEGAGGGDADRRVSSNNLKQIGLAMHTYHDALRAFPAHAIYSKDGKTPLLSWRVAILPYIEQQALYQQFKLDEPWDSDHNKKLLAIMPKIYEPVGMGKKGDGKTYYQVFTGPDTLFDGPKGLRITNVRDGTSNTILVVEANDPVEWTKPADLVLPKAGEKLPALGGMFKNGMNVLFCDGSVRWARREIDAATLRALITPAGGEIVDDTKIEP